MNYPRVSESKLIELAPNFLAQGFRELHDDEIERDGEGYFDETAIEELAVGLSKELRSFEKSSRGADRDAFEGQASIMLYRGLKLYPTVALDDPGFWRYLSLAHFWEFVKWREWQAFESGDQARYLKYIDAKNVSECVLTRAFLRAQLMDLGGDLQLAAAIPDATDFWRSHILRVRTGTAPRLAVAFAREQLVDRMGTAELRALARKINRTWSNVALHIYDSDEARDLVGELRSGGEAAHS